MLTRRRLLQLSALSVPALALAARKQGWNLLVVSSDEHNPRMISGLGHPVVRTPRIDGLLARGTHFDAAYAAAPICAPARQSLLTGLWPSEHGQYGNDWAFHPQSTTLASAFATAGFATGSFGKMHTGHESLGFGFEERGSAWKSWPGMPADAANPDQALFSGIEDRRLRGRPVPEGGFVHDEVVVDDAIDFLRRHKRERFFLYASLLQPHYPWNLPEADYFAYDPAKVDLPVVDEAELQNNPVALKRYYDNGWFAMSEAQRRLCLARYYAGVSFMDKQLGRLLDQVEALKLDRRTVIVYLSDHGEMAGEKGLWLKSLMYEASARIPLVLALPGGAGAGTRSPALISQVDILPTLAAVLGVDLPQVSGRDVLSEPRQVVFSMEGAQPEERWPRLLMVRDARWKLVHHRRGYSGSSNFQELYDLQADPMETRSRRYEPPEGPEVAAALTELGRAFVDGLAEPSLPPSKRGE